MTGVTSNMLLHSWVSLNKDEGNKTVKTNIFTTSSKWTTCMFFKHVFPPAKVKGSGSERVWISSVTSLVGAVSTEQISLSHSLAGLHRSCTRGQSSIRHSCSLGGRQGCVVNAFRVWCSSGADTVLRLGYLKQEHSFCFVRSPWGLHRVAGGYWELMCVRKLESSHLPLLVFLLLLYCESQKA